MAKTEIAYIQVQALAGSDLDACMREALETAIKYNADVRLAHNHVLYVTQIKDVRKAANIVK